MPPHKSGASPDHCCAYLVLPPPRIALHRGMVALRGTVDRWNHFAAPIGCPPRGRKTCRQHAERWRRLALHW
jgi:hypothetical protein